MIFDDYYDGATFVFKIKSNNIRCETEWNKQSISVHCDILLRTIIIIWIAAFTHTKDVCRYYNNNISWEEHNALKFINKSYFM